MKIFLGVIGIISVFLNKMLRNSRYVDFSKDNLKTHSIELTGLLLSGCSEIDVILKEICLILDNNSKPQNIKDYQEAITQNLSEMIDEKIDIGTSFYVRQPFSSWNSKKSPVWWTMHNKVKHERNTFYKEAYLDNVLDSISALFLCVNYYYNLVLSDIMHERTKKGFT